MAGEIVYADLNLPSGFPGSRAPISAQPLGAQSPQWYRTALWVGWMGNLVLVIAVLALGMWISHPMQLREAPSCTVTAFTFWVTIPELMEDEEVYVVMNLKPKGGSSAVPLPARIQGAQCPRWHCTALWGGWAGNMVLLVAVIVLGIWVSHLASEKGQTLAAPGSDGAGSRDAATPPGSGDPSTAACCTRLDSVWSQLCPLTQPGPAGGSRCELCPTDWRLRGDKCYWVSTENKTWNESRSDCAARGFQLLVIQDREELEALQDLTQSKTQLWVGLSRPSPEKAWTWLDGSQLNQTRLPVSGPAEGNSCGMMKGNQIHSQDCSSAHQWICQRDAILL